MDDTDLLAVLGIASTLICSSCLVSSAIAAKRGMLPGVPLLSSRHTLSNTKGTPLPIPALSKGTSPWNISWLGSNDRMKTTDSTLTINIKKGVHGNESGAAFRANPWNKLPADSVTLSYDVYFPNDFNWVKGGKLPGVCFGTKNGECSTGGDWQPDQGSFRIMWLEGGLAMGYAYMAVKGGPKAAYAAQGEGYKAVTEPSDRTGHDLWKKRDKGLQLQKGWNTVTMQLGLNTPGKRDGTISVTINGVTKKVSDVMFRQNAAVKFTNVLIVSFFGGGSNEWNSPKDTSISFRNFKFDAS